MRSIPISAPDSPRDQLRHTGMEQLIDRCARLRPGTGDELSTVAEAAPAPTGSALPPPD